MPCSATESISFEAENMPTLPDVHMPSISLTCLHPEKVQALHLSVVLITACISVCIGINPLICSPLAAHAYETSK